MQWLITYIFKDSLIICLKNSNIEGTQGNIEGTQFHLLILFGY